MSDHAVTNRINPDDPALREAVTQILDQRLTEITDTWARRLADAGWPDAGQWLREQTQP